ncbi:hypothetical protein DAMNIGENAA_29880 [Desulforhabdus amnigena]|jgi:hypothetical protein|uniref:Uncharacterized protein n=1 Tax=Desulforhabdus amnigena TaxID=40218 RepID=A0A9W6FV85_9BACT|nr:hypothetical protein DAMNIGENAA_29880 [Desulforhabdus amnigena]
MEEEQIHIPFKDGLQELPDKIRAPGVSNDSFPPHVPQGEGRGGASGRPVPFPRRERLVIRPIREGTNDYGISYQVGNQLLFAWK